VSAALVLGDFTAARHALTSVEGGLSDDPGGGSPLMSSMPA
jgi:hypothetical protein